MLTPLSLARIALVAGVLAAVPAAAQGGPAGREAHLYGGVGIGDGFGLVAVGSVPALDVFTREVVLYGAYRSGEGADDGRLVAAFGVGGGLRLLRLASVARTRTIPTSDLDVGVRVGPSFSAALGQQSDAQRARAFAVFADPFVRLTRRVAGRSAFTEVGPQSPIVRVGLSARLGR